VSKKAETIRSKSNIPAWGLHVIIPDIQHDETKKVENKHYRFTPYEPKL
jgi:hypothetical protein